MWLPVGFRIVALRGVGELVVKLPGRRTVVEPEVKFSSADAYSGGTLTGCPIKSPSRTVGVLAGAKFVRHAKAQNEPESFEPDSSMGIKVRTSGRHGCMIYVRDPNGIQPQDGRMRLAWW
jgi:hypothetical protein